MNENFWWWLCNVKVNEEICCRETSKVFVCLCCSLCVLYGFLCESCEEWVLRWEEGEDFVKRITYHQRNISPLFYFLLFSICFISLWSACIFMWLTDWLCILHFQVLEKSWLNGHLMKMRRRGGGMGNEFTIRQGIKMTRLTA